VIGIEQTQRFADTLAQVTTVPLKDWARRMSTSQRSKGGSASFIHCASAMPAPPYEAMPMEL